MVGGGIAAFASEVFMGAIRLRIRIDRGGRLDAAASRVGSYPIRRCLILLSALQRNDLVALGSLGDAERRPLLHQPAPLLKHIAAAIGGFGLVTYGMG